MLDYLTFDPDGTPWWRRVRWWAWALVLFYGSAFYVVGWIPLQSVMETKVPPFELLTRSEGTVFFKKNGGRRGGYLLGLKTNAGNVLFNCGTAPTNTPDCVNINLVKDLSGKKGTVWWYQKPPVHGRTRNFAAQVEVAGKLIRTYSKSLWYVENAKPSAKWDVGVLAVFFMTFAASTIYIGVRKNG